MHTRWLRMLQYYSLLHNIIVCHLSNQLLNKYLCCRLFAWQPDKLRGERPKNERVVVLKNLFDPKLFDQNLSLILEYRQDLQEECAKCGALKKVVIYDVSIFLILNSLVIF